MRRLDTVVFFIFAVLSFGASIVLNAIVKDAQDELDSISAEIERRIEKQRK
jgi:uncharacterized membrane protein (DUF485 family)